MSCKHYYDGRCLRPRPPGYNRDGFGSPDCSYKGDSSKCSVSEKLAKSYESAPDYKREGYRNKEDYIESLFGRGALP